MFVYFLYSNPIQTNDTSATITDTKAGIMIFKVNVVFLLVLNAICPTIKAVEELKVEVTKPAKYCPGRARNGDFLTIHYTGRFASNGKIFDSSRQKLKPYTFTLGRREVIQGYEIGMQKMCLGEHRKFTVPPHLGKNWANYSCIALANILCHVSDL